MVLCLCVGCACVVCLCVVCCCCSALSFAVFLIGSAFAVCVFFLFALRFVCRFVGC